MPALLLIALCAVLPARYSLCIVLAFVAWFFVESSHADVSTHDNRGLLLIFALAALLLGVTLLRVLVIVVVWFLSPRGTRLALVSETVSPLAQRLLNLCCLLQGFFIGLALIYSSMPVAQGGARSLAALVILSALLWLLSWVTCRVPRTIGKIASAYLRGMALVPLLLIGAAGWTTWQVAKEAERLAGTRAYCIGVPDADREYRPPTSRTDLMTIGFTPFPFDYYTYHGAILLDGDGGPAWGNWSYSLLSFDLDHDDKDESVPIPRFSCTMVTNFIAHLPWF